jgi:hypothetical protein
MLVLADTIRTAALPALAAIAAVGWLIVRSRDAIVARCIRVTGERAGSFIGWSFVSVGGYGWLIIGSLGAAVWCVDLFE